MVAPDSVAECCPDEGIFPLRKAQVDVIVTMHVA